MDQFGQRQRLPRFALQGLLPREEEEALDHPVDYTYACVDSIKQELEGSLCASLKQQTNFNAEFISYAEVGDFEEGRLAFTIEQSGRTWQQFSRSEKLKYIVQVLDSLDTANFRIRERSASILTYIAYGEGPAHTCPL